MDAIIKQKNIGNHRQQTATHSPTSHKCFCVRRKLQTIRETTFAMRGNAKPFGKLFVGGPQIILFSSDRRNQ